VRSAPLLLVALLVLESACSKSKPTTTSPPSRTTSRRVPPRDTLVIRDPDLERRIGRIELHLMERDAQVADLQMRLDDAREEVVRTLSKLQTVASRAEAASGMAEAELALQSLRRTESQLLPQELAQVTRLVQQSTAEFNKQNYGGALYLAGQAKGLARSFTGRLVDANPRISREGETPFALPIRLKTTSRGNVREGPGTNFAIAYGVEPGLPLIGYSYVDEWIRIGDENGRSGWIFRPLVSRR